MQLSDEMLVILSLKCGLPASVLDAVFEHHEQITSAEMDTRDKGRADIRKLLPVDYNIWPRSGPDRIQYHGRIIYCDSFILHNDTRVNLSDILAMVETQCN